jgi:hypothetical protein
MPVCNHKVGKMVFAIDYTNDQDLWEKIGHLDEVYSNQKCGKCGNEDVKFVKRESTKGNKTFKYYELWCSDRQKCKAKLAFGIHNTDDKTLFPKRKTKDGSYLENDGWVSYDKGENPEE